MNTVMQLATIFCVQYSSRSVVPHKNRQGKKYEITGRVVEPMMPMTAARSLMLDAIAYDSPSHMSGIHLVKHRG